MAEKIEYYGGPIRQTEFTDRDGDHIVVERVLGEPELEGSYVYVYGDGAYAPAKELIEAIEKAAGTEPTEAERLAGIEPDTSIVTDAFAPLWTEVQYRPARAIKVTPNLVRTLADVGRVQEELAPLASVFDQHTGEPKGVTWYDYRRALDVTAEANDYTYVIMRPGQVPQMMGAMEFELTYQEVVG